MRNNQGSPAMVITIFLIGLILAMLGYGGTMMRGAAWGIGRESVHMMFRR